MIMLKRWEKPDTKEVRVYANGHEERSCKLYFYCEDEEQDFFRVRASGKIFNPPFEVAGDGPDIALARYCLKEVGLDMETASWSDILNAAT